MPCHDDWDYKNFVKVSELSVHILCCSWDSEKNGCKDSTEVTNENANKKATEINCKQLISSWILQFNTS